ncbi:MAG: signal peptidase I [Aristaeellaceae bacterium]
MKQEPTRPPETPSINALREELQRARYHRRFAAAMRHTIIVLVLIVLSALAASWLLFPAMRLHSDAMAPTLARGDVVVALRHVSCNPGDIIAYSVGDKLMVKRVIARGGDTVQLTEDGSVLVNGEALDEPYVQTQALGTCDIDMPFTVPEGQLFVMGDQREVSVDSRSTAAGCVAQEQIIGRVILRAWPIGAATYYPSAAGRPKEE